MATTLTVITENTVVGKRDGLYAEHGLSVFLERPGLRMLFDTGPAGIATLHNAPRLGIDLRSVDAIALGHGHADHTGGLLGVLRTIGKRIPVFAHPGIFGDRYSRRADGNITYAGMPYKREAREALEGLGRPSTCPPRSAPSSPADRCTPSWAGPTWALPRRNNWSRLQGSSGRWISARSVSPTALA